MTSFNANYLPTSLKYDILFNPDDVDFSKPGDIIKLGGAYYMLIKRTSAFLYAKAVIINSETNQLELQPFSQKFIYKTDKFTGRPNNIKESSGLTESFYTRFTNLSHNIKDFLDNAEEDLVKQNLKKKKLY